MATLSLKKEVAQDSPKTIWQLLRSASTSSSFKDQSQGVCHCQCPMPCSNLFQTSNLTVTGNKIQWHCQRGSRQHSLPSAQPTEENNLYDSLVCPVQGTRVEEKLGSVSALIPDVSADRVLQNGANPGNLSQCSQHRFLRARQRALLCYTRGECQWNSGTTSFSFLLLWKRNKLCQDRDQCLLLLYHHLFTFNPGKQKQTDFVSPSATDELSWSSSITQTHQGVMSTTEIYIRDRIITEKEQGRLGEGRFSIGKPSKHHPEEQRSVENSWCLSFRGKDDSLSFVIPKAT